MGALGGLIGLNGGAGGTGFQGPSGANIQNPVNANQLSSAYTDTQAYLGAQNNLLNALQAQNGLQNQSNVYGQLQDVAAGRGPNPAQAMLNQATGQNVANQSALMAGQRGASQNVGLIGRQAAMQGSNAQQQAAGQAATMQANQSLNALNSAGQMANTQASNQIGQTNANSQAQQAQQQALLGAQTAYNQAQAGSQASVNAGNTALANTTMQGQHGLIGGAMQGAAAAMGMAQGGVVHRMAEGGDSSAFQGPQSKFGQFLSGMSQNMSSQASSDMAPTTSSKQLQEGASDATEGLINALKPAKAAPKTMAGGMNASELSSMPVMAAASGGKVPAMVSPGEKYLPPSAVDQVKRGANPMSVGETIPGKPKVGGAKNSYSNDTVPKTLEEGGIVVPRSKTQSKDADRASADFVHKVLAKRKAKC